MTKEKEQEQKVMTFKEKLIAFKGGAQNLEKRGKAPQVVGGYAYFTADDVFQYVNRKEVELRLCSATRYELISNDRIEINNKQMFSCHIKATITVWDVDSAESIEFCAFGKGTDTTDKDVGKAHTDARKEAWSSFLNIFSGPDIEMGAESEHQQQGQPQSKEVSGSSQAASGSGSVAFRTPGQGVRQSDFVPLPEEAASCPDGHGNFRLRNGRLGPFWSCPNYPECKNYPPKEFRNAKLKNE